MTRPPKDPNPVASTGGTANVQGQSIFTGDWNSLVDDYISKTDNTTQTIRPTAVVAGSILQLLDPDGLHGFNFQSDTIHGAQIQFQLLRQSTDTAAVLVFGIQNLDTALTESILFKDYLNTLGFGVGTLVIGDDGTLGGVVTPKLVFPAFTNGIDMTLNLMVPLGSPGVDVIGSSSSGTAKGVARPDHLHNMSTSALGTPAQVALAGARGSSTQVPRFDHAHKALAGTMALVNADETQANATVPNADTVLKTYTLAANTYSKIITEAEGYGTFGALSTNQAVNIKVKYAGAQVGNTIVLDAALGAASNIPFPVKASAAFTGGGTVDVTIGAAVADANTAIFLNSLRVFGAV